MKTIYFILVFFLLSTFLYSTIINVPADQPTIQEGINVAVDADTVLVQPGTYVENINYNGKLITVASLFLTTQDTTYISQTVIDGDSINSVVTFESGENSSTLLTGFTITNGNAFDGGGIYCNNSSPGLDNLTIAGNSADYGGGISCGYNSSPSLVNVIIVGNYVVGGFASGYGGGIYCSGSNPILQNVTISDNSAESTDSYGGFGGGISCSGSNPILQNVTIIGNSAISRGGGGISCWDSSPSLMNVTITGNHALNGGGIYCDDSSPSLENVIITANSANNFGGGIHCFSNSNPILLNVTITGNSTPGYYSGGGGIACLDNSSPSLTNCIMWNDSPEEIYFYEYYSPNTITIAYSDIQGGEAGIVTNNNGIVNWLEGNIDENPLFVGTGENPYSLLEDSPCIDTGIPDTTGLNLPPYDIIGNLRIWDGDGNGSAIIDMGAYEYGAPPYVDIDDNVIIQTTEGFLHQNYPNPFNPITTIIYSLKKNARVTLIIYNIKGQKVKQLVSDQLLAGKHSVIWNGKDDYGKSVSSGIYFYKLKTGTYEKTKRMVLLK